MKDGCLLLFPLVTEPPRPSTSGPRRRRPRRAGRLTGLLLSVVAALVVLASPAGALLTGVDVASFQHPGNDPIDWDAVRASGKSFAFVKATEATNYSNPWFQRDWDGAGRAGLYRGAYHFARPKLPISTAVDQARYFVATTGTMTGDNDLPGVLDLETDGGLSKSDLAQWTRTWLGEVKRLTGKAPIIYTGYYFWRDEVGSPADIAVNYRLWLPSYPADPESTTFKPLVPGGWASWTFWQYSSTAKVPGINGPVDVNRFCCDVASLAALGGAAAAAGNPFGNLEAADRAPGTITVTGWTIDPDTTGSIPVHIYVDGVWAGATTADARRPDVAAAYPGWSADHGFSATVGAGPGAHTVCAFAINTGPGSTNPVLGCRNVVGNPVGNLETATSPSGGTVRVTGWALDPDTTGPVAVDVYVDGELLNRGATGGSRTDVASAFPNSGATSAGFDLRVFGRPSGAHQVCASAINTGSGTENAQLGCRTVDVGGANPFGNLETTTPGFGTVRVGGWALDPETTAAVDVHVYVDGRWAGLARADQSRDDVAAVFPGVGSGHGFVADVAMTGGPHTVCAFAINVGGGYDNPSLGCRTVQGPSSPGGNLEAVGRFYNLIQPVGWAIDPDSGAAVRVRVTVDGVAVLTATSGGDRPDVGAVFPVFGSAHGFGPVIAVSGGPHRVCVTALNAGVGGSDTPLGCRDI